MDPMGYIIYFNIFHFLPSPFLCCFVRILMGCFVPRGLLLPLQRADTSGFWGPLAQIYSLRFFSIEVVFHRLVEHVQFFVVVVVSWNFTYAFWCSFPPPPNSSYHQDCWHYYLKLDLWLESWVGSSIPTYLVFVSLQERALVINKNYWEVSFLTFGAKRFVKACECSCGLATAIAEPKFWGHPLLPVGSDPGSFSSQLKDVQKIGVGSCRSTLNLVIQWWQKKQHVSSIVHALIGSLSWNSVVKWDFDF